MMKHTEGLLRVMQGEGLDHLSREETARCCSLQTLARQQVFFFASKIH